VALQHLDLVAVGVLDEEEPRHQPAVAVELLDLGGLQPELLEPPVLGVEVVDRERDVAVGVTVLVGLAAPLVDRELDLEVVLGVAQVDQREVVEVEAVGDLEPERPIIEVARAARPAPAPSCGSPWPSAPPSAVLRQPKT
jgi:hypothetical protein